LDNATTDDDDDAPETGALAGATTGAAGALKDAATGAAGALEDATIGDDDGLEEDAAETVGVVGAWDVATTGDDDEVEDDAVEDAVDDGDGCVDSDPLLEPNSGTGVNEEDEGSMERPRDNRSRRMYRGEDDEAVDRIAWRDISMLRVTSLSLSTHCLYAGNALIAVSNSRRSW
jgi:hypothetical protein